MEKSNLAFVKYMQSENRSILVGSIIGIIACILVILFASSNIVRMKRYEKMTQAVLLEKPEVAEKLIKIQYQKENDMMIGAIGFAVFMGSTLACVLRFHVGLRRELVVTVKPSENAHSKTNI
jgi:Sec-independent protein secretion pathway component TatC